MATVFLMLPACTASDMQGHNPVEYYAEHPIKSHVEQRHALVKARFAPGQARLSSDEIDRLNRELNAISLPAVSLIRLGFPAGDAQNEARRRYLVKLLRNLGYQRAEYETRSLPALERGAVQLDVTYAAAVSPDCPDWRTSPEVNYSNTSVRSNFRCAQEVNTGLMVADPHDLEQGSSKGVVATDTMRAAKAVQDYRAGAAESSGSGSDASSSATGGSTSTSAK